MPEFVLNIDLNVLNHLGLNLYSNVPAVLAELIANSWDADANEVDISVDFEGEERKIVIRDNGCGMNSKSLQDKFLTVGYQRRTDASGDLTLNLKRYVMGRKGIGKLSAFSIAETVQIVTKESGGTPLSIKLDVGNIRQAIEKGKVYHPTVEDVPSGESFKYSGTVLILSNLKKRVNTSLDQNLSQRIARRFSIFSNDFRVVINGREVTFQDRNYFQFLEYALYYGNFDVAKFKHDSKYVVQRTNNCLDQHKKYIVNGWLGLVEHSGNLQSGTDNLNKVSVLTRGKVAVEDILESYREGGLYTKYVIGELEPDFLDSTNEEDIATSSRQYFIQDDDRYIQLRNFVKQELSYLRSQRVSLKNEQGAKKATEIPAIKEWYESLKGDSRTSAKKLFGRINEIAIDDIHRKTLYKHGILAFEHLHHKEKLNQLDNLSIENLDAVVQLFSELDDIEATWYYQITEGRLDVIRKLYKDVSKDALEKIIQQHIYTHLWLLDPSWDRATENPTMEKTVISAFKKISTKLTDSERKGRLDIRYKKAVGKHIIIELKRGSVVTRSPLIVDQIDKYIEALRKQLRLADEGESVEAICLVGTELSDWETPERRQDSNKLLEAKNIRVVTYQQLIKDADAAYQQYLNFGVKRSKIKLLLEEIDASDSPLES